MSNLIDSIDSLPTIRVKNRGSHNLMRIAHLVDIDTYILLPRGVYVTYDRAVNGTVRLNIRWGVRKQDYTYNHETLSGLLKMYLTQISSDVSVQKSGLFDSAGLIRPSRKSLPVAPSEVFKTHTNELDVVITMCELLDPTMDINVEEMLSKPWIELKDLIVQ